ncbi:MAG: hypothetical protein DBX55_02940 [Verrucomicrobia bacterium]|nr:MAG: hypothetical protein DBX55_02940 [Verrucomicrobiota bacterium]
MKNGMKFFSPNLLSALTALFSSAAFCAADTVYFDVAGLIADTSAGQQVSLSETILSGDGGKTYWYSSYDASAGVFSDGITDASFSFLDNPDNTVIFGGSIDAEISGLDGRSIVIDGSHIVNVGKIVSFKTDTWNGLKNAFLKSVSTENTITIGTYALNRNSQRIGFGGSQTVLNIGVLVDGGYQLGSLSDPLNYIEVGSMTLYTGNNNRASYFAAVGGAGRGLDNPDAKIGELTTSISSNYMASNLLFANSSFQADSGSLDTHSYVQIGMVGGNAGLGMGYVSSGSTGSVTYIFINSQDSSSAGNLVQTAGSVSNGAIGFNPMTTRGAKVNYVMRSIDANGNYADKIQSFSGDYSVISGDVILISGGLFINYGGYGNSRETVSIGGLENDFTVKGSLVFDRAAGAPCAKFGSTADVGNTYVFGGLEVAGGGELVVRFNVSGGSSGLVYDKLSIDGEIGGGGTLAIEIADAFGGHSDDVSIIKALIRADSRSGEKIISWNADGPVDISFSAVDGMQKWIDGDTGIEYAFAAHAADDGLYISYVAVPEPAVASALASAVALGAAAFAGHRKRREARAFRTR